MVIGAQTTASSGSEGFYLRTKLLAPALPQHTIQRGRLLPESSAENMPHVTLVVAPAGWGKTTLLAQAYHHQKQRGHGAAWITLDARDNDPSRFWLYILKAVLPQSVGQALTLLDEHIPAPTEAVITAFLNALIDLNNPLEIFLDDYHAIHHPAIHQSVSYFTEQLPPHIRLIIASRSDPPLPLARWRVRAQLREIREHELRFTLQEAEIFLKHNLPSIGTNLPTLYERTEGWAAGMYLITLLAPHHESQSRPHALLNPQRAIRDYLYEEVLNQQSAEVRTFLLQTSVVPYLTASLCNSLTQRTDSQDMLTLLEQKNLFIVPLDEERQWYRYHGLFTDMLKDYLLQTFPEQVHCLHKRARCWYENQGMISEAIEHALQGNEVNHAYRLIRQEAPAILAKGAFVTLIDWLKQLPAAQLQSDTQLCLLFVRALLHAGDKSEAQYWLNSVIASPAAQDHAQVLAVQARLASFDGNIQQAGELARQALELLPENDVASRSDVAFDFGFAAHSQGDAVAAEQAFTEARHCGKKAGNLYGTLLAERYLSIQKMTLGKLGEARQLFESALKERQNDHSSARGMPYVGLGILMYEWNDLAQSDTYLTKGLMYARQGGDVKTLAWGYVDLAILRYHQGDPEGVKNALHQAECVGVGAPVARTRALLGLWDRRLDEARRWADEYHLGIQPVTSIAEDDLLVLIRLLNAQGQRRRALNALEALESRARHDQRTGSLIHILVVKAVTLFAERELEQAVATLYEALELAEPESYIRTFINEGPPLTELLRRIARRSRADNAISTYVLRLLSALGESPDQTAVSEQLTQPDPLSNRELEILGLIASGLTNQAIAEQLGVSLSTIKTHINNLYSKLMVKTRTQALAKARALGLLD